MSDTHDPWSGEHPGELLSLHVDGDLAGPTRRRVEVHLAACGRCRELVADLRDLAGRARRLPDRPPESELWTGIADEIGAAATSAGNAGGGAGRDGDVPLLGREVRTSVLRLAAAAVLVAAAASGATWLLAGAGAGPPRAAPTYGAVAGEGGGLRGAPPVSLAAATPRGLLELEARYREAREELDPETRRMLDRNLRTIDRAIADARRLLADRPDDRYVRDHLTETLRRKAQFLGLAVRLTRAG